MIINKECKTQSTTPSQSRLSSIYLMTMKSSIINNASKGLVTVLVALLLSQLPQRDDHQCGWLIQRSNAWQQQQSVTPQSSQHRHPDRRHRRRYPNYYYIFHYQSRSFLSYQQHQWSLLIRNMKVDPYRDNNNIRPSLHPITINILVQVLKLRATSMIEEQRKKDDLSNDANTMSTQQPVVVTNDDTTDGVAGGMSWSDQPIDIVMIVSQVATKAIIQRNKSSTTTATTNMDQMMILTNEEQQTITGRAIGVMVRLEQLQHLLHQKCSMIPWVQKYNEWHTFGLVKQHVHNNNNNDGSSTTGTISAIATNSSTEFDEQSPPPILLLNDPLLLLNHAECLLALFIHIIEIPELHMKNCTVPDQSVIDFLDSDRQQVLLQ